MSIQNKRKTAPTLPQEVTGIIRIFYGLPGSETVSGFLHSYRDAHRLYCDAEIEYMTREFMSHESGINMRIRLQKAYAKVRKARAELNRVF